MEGTSPAVGRIRQLSPARANGKAICESPKVRVIGGGSNARPHKVTVVSMVLERVRTAVYNPNQEESHATSTQPAILELPLHRRAREYNATSPNTDKQPVDESLGNDCEGDSTLKHPRCDGENTQGVCTQPVQSL